MSLLGLTIWQFWHKLFFFYSFGYYIQKMCFKNVQYKKKTKNQSQPLIRPVPLRLSQSLFDIIIHGKLLIVMENWSIQTEIRDHGRLCGSAQEQIDLAVQPTVNVSGICEAKSQWACGSRWLSDWALSVWACGQPKQVNPHPLHHPVLSLTPHLQQSGAERGKFRGQGFSEASHKKKKKKLLNDLISGDIHLRPLSPVHSVHGSGGQRG